MTYRREPRDIHEVAAAMKEVKAETRKGFFDVCKSNPLNDHINKVLSTDNCIVETGDPHRPTKLRRVGPGKWEPV